VSFSSFARAVGTRTVAAASGFLLLFVFAHVAAAQPAEFARGPVPSWVEPHEPQSRFVPPANQISDGTYYVLLDHQTRLDKGGRTIFRHIAAQALNPTGVEGLATIQIAFDPSFQKLALHELAVIRDGRRMSQLETADVQVLRRETDLERSILDGSKSATILLSDVRVGDIVDYSFSLEGMNPVFDGRHFGGFSLQWEEPVHELKLRLLHREGDQLAIRSVNTDLQPRSTVNDGWRDLRWSRDQVPPFGIESDAPAWSDLYPRVEWSAFADWNTVARWSDGLYGGGAASSAPLREVIARIAAENVGAEARLLAALRFVQAEVRYTGIEAGAGSHRPRSPDLVLERRFGDCKDKTQLLIAMLAALDIEAKPALVYTDRLVDASVQLPHPGYFDHVIVRTRVGGKDYWLDPTRPTQVAPLDMLYQPDFGLALVVDPTTRALERMPVARGSRHELEATFDSRAGVGKPAKYTLRTTAYGGSAEVLRQDLAGASRDDMLKQYLKYYSSYYDGIRSTAPLDVADDASRNVVTVTEHYEIPEFWPYSESEERQVASLHMPDMLSVLARPASVTRKSPMALVHPQELRLTTIVQLPEDWPLRPESGAVEDPHFRFDYEISGTKERQVFTQTYRTLADQVEPDAVAKFAENVDRARAEVGYEFYYNGDAPAALPWSARINWMLALVAAMLFAFFVWIARRVYRYDPLPQPVAARDRLAGIRGWLLFPALGALIAPFVPLVQMYLNADAFMHPTWESLTHPGGASYHAAWAPMLLFELAGQLASMVLSVLVLVLFLRKRTSAPIVYVVAMVSGLLLVAIDFAFIEVLDMPGVENAASDWAQLRGQFLPVILWSAYMIRSRRVHSTFVRRLAPAPAETPPRPGDEATAATAADGGSATGWEQYGISSNRA